MRLVFWRRPKPEPPKPSNAADFAALAALYVADHAESLDPAVTARIGEQLGQIK